ncbi:MAG: hypothetical protein KGP12_05040 [Actinomycetales bacterium]|nr:hypothetical protein [Actinomycetales bacterium]
MALLAGCSSAPQGAGVSSAAAPAIKGDAADPADDAGAADPADDAGAADPADDSSAGEEPAASGDQSGSAEAGAGVSESSQSPGDAGEGDTAVDEVTYDIPEDAGDWELPPDNPEADPDWGVPTELLTEDYDGIDVPTEAELQDLLRQWQALLDQWNATWNQQLPDPRLPDPQTTSIEPRNDDNPKGLPSVSYQDDLKLSHDACAGGTATYTVKIDGQTVRSGQMTETRPGHYEAIVAATAPTFGSTTVDITVACPAGSREGTGFDMYIDPAGTIVDQDGNLLVGARAVLLRSDTKNGPYAVVPDGSAIMAPSNRKNPWVTGQNGVFQWDVVKGWYVVRAYAAGCTHPTDPKTEFAQTEALEVPPPRLGLVITMKCSSKAKVVRTIQVSKPGSVSGKGAVGSTLRATAPKSAGAKVAVAWQRVSTTGNITPIPGAKSATYTVVAADKGSTVRAVFTLSKTGHAARQVAAKGVRIS